MDTSNKIVRYGLKQAFSYIEKNPEENMIKIMQLSVCMQAREVRNLATGLGCCTGCILVGLKKRGIQ